jgi:hypothetical protein
MKRPPHDKQVEDTRSEVLFWAVALVDSVATSPLATPLRQHATFQSLVIASKKYQLALARQRLLALS